MCEVSFKSVCVSEVSFRFMLLSHPTSNKTGYTKTARQSIFALGATCHCATKQFTVMDWRVIFGTRRDHLEASVRKDQTILASM
jgi:hypothetical protein